MSNPYLVKPDGEFLHRILALGGDDLKKCYQCGTCSVVCELSGQRKPFPRKEIVWAQWGLKDRLVADPDVWLCYHCNDCSTHCPRGARPGDVMAAIRRESVLHFAVPRFLGRWVNQPKYAPLLLLIPTVLLGLALLVRGPAELISGKIVFPVMFPHWLLIGFFTFFSVLVCLAVGAGVARFWKAMKDADAREGTFTPAKGLAPSIVSALKSILTHDNFALCTTERSRFLSHLAVFYGFLAMSVVALWVMTAKFNPLIKDDFVYPFNFWNPWRMLANLGGVVLVAGCLWMIRERIKEGKRAGVGSFFDWAFISTLLAVALTGLLTEALHYVRLEPHRYIAYFVHLVLVFALLVYLPYSKFAHMFYRATAMVYAEYSGRTGEPPIGPAGEKQPDEQAEKDPAEKSND